MFLMWSDWKVETEKKVPMKENCHKTKLCFLSFNKCTFLPTKKYSFYRNAKCRTMPFYCLVYIMFWQRKKTTLPAGLIVTKGWFKKNIHIYVCICICVHIYKCPYIFINYNSTCPSSFKLQLGCRLSATLTLSSSITCSGGQIFFF